MYSDKLDLFFLQKVKIFLSNYYVMHCTVYFLLKQFVVYLQVRDQDIKQDQRGCQ